VKYAYGNKEILKSVFILIKAHDVKKKKRNVHKTVSHATHTHGSAWNKDTIPPIPEAWKSMTDSSVDSC